MNIRIISGRYGGRKIDAPDNSRTHPMGERVRNALFNSISSEVQGAVVLDAFAGTGAVGFEALSRGAERVVFVERDRIAQKILANNADILGAASSCSIVRAAVAAWISTVSNVEFDIIFADPPYYDPQLSAVHKLFDILKPGGLMVVSHPDRSEVPIKKGVSVVDNRSYGNATLTFYRREG